MTLEEAKSVLAALVLENVEIVRHRQQWERQQVRQRPG
jgi:hypothetical protein